MVTVTLEEDAVRLPQSLRERYHLEPGTPIRIVETSDGMLLIPLTDEPMPEELKQELAAWQAVAFTTLADFPYEDEEPE